MPSLIKHAIQITIIIGDTGREECDAFCGIDWSLPEVIDLANQQIKGRFGDKVQLECLNLSQAAANREALAWSELIKNQNRPLPLLLINGQPRISGQFDIRQLLDVIEAEMEIGV